MKKCNLILTALATTLMMAGCNGEQPHQHVDANHDGICDGCGASGMVFEHVDTNSDGKCDVCGQDMPNQEPSHTHVDLNHDGVCDSCGTGGMSVEHVDADKDGKCDVCGGNMPGEDNPPCSHVDLNHDGVCDSCGAPGMIVDHVDADKDGKCDVCGGNMPGEDNPPCAHIDTDHNGKCDNCGEDVEVIHVDADKDGKCDVCGADVSSGGGEGQGEGGEGDIHIEPIDAPTVFEECMAYDYSNMKVSLEVCTGYSQTYEGYEATGYYAEEYYLGEGKYVVFDESTYAYYIDSGYPMSYFMYQYADYEGKNYKWTEGSWADDQHQGHDYAGYILEYKDHMKVGMDNTWFYMNNLLDNLEDEDVTYSLGTFVINEDKIDKINNTALYFTIWDDVECTVSGLDIGVDKDNHYYFKSFKSYVDPESDRSPYVVMTFTDFGTTTVPYGCDEVPTPTSENTFDTYWDMSGEPQPVEIYIDELQMKVNANIKYFMEEEDFIKLAGKSYEDALSAGEYEDDATLLDSTKLYVYKDGHYFETTESYAKDPSYEEYDLVLYEGETIDVSLFVGPETWNKEGLTEWRYTGDEAVDAYKEENGCYPESGFNAIFDYNDAPRLTEATKEAQHTHRHRWLSAVHAGECEIWAEHWAPYQGDTFSNKLKVLVLPPQGESQDQETASYAFHFTNCEKMYNDPNNPEDYWRTEFAASNLGNSKFNNPEFEITGRRAKLIEARYTEAFENKGNEQLLYFGVGDQDDYQSYSYNEVIFDLKDQEVSSMSCYFSLHVSNHLSNLENLDEAYILTSPDGDFENNATKYNLKNKLVNHWNQLNSNGYMDALLYEREFTSNARYVMFRFKSKSIGRMLGVVVSDIKFYSNDTCSNHVVKPNVDVTGLSVDCENALTMSQGTTMVVTPTVAPADATNQKVIFTSANPKVVKVNQSGELMAVGKGTTTVTVYTDFMDGDGEHFEKLITVTVGDKPSIDSAANGTFISASPTASIMVDSANSKLTIGFLAFNDGNLAGTSFTLYDIVANQYIFLSSDGKMTLKASFANEFGSLTIDSITVAGVETPIGVTLTK